jgi:hypothetical protein
MTNTAVVAVDKVPVAPACGTFAYTFIMSSSTRLQLLPQVESHFDFVLGHFVFVTEVAAASFQQVTEELDNQQFLDEDEVFP